MREGTICSHNKGFGWPNEKPITHEPFNPLKDF
jgi:hypothetical protein